MNLVFEVRTAFLMASCNFNQSKWSSWHLDVPPMHNCVRNAFASCENAALGCRDLTDEVVL